ncbi:MAG: BrnT family toxin [Bryobacteraceae bacterium]|nr:BrnT family toxin [Bryobacteraceae bacterium]
MDVRHFQFEWDETKTSTNLRKHGVSFELATSIFDDSRILTLADTTHTEAEER